jgi:AcrR family transcriptional regulator
MWGLITVPAGRYKMFDAIPTPGSTKYRIMNAAEDIVASLGASHLTFDEVAKRTGISKGGILYHFPSKKDLMRAMLLRVTTDFDNKRREIAANIEQTGLVAAKTYIRASFEENEGDRPSSSAVLAAAANDPELLAVMRQHYKATFKEIRAHGKKSSLMALLVAAVDGIWLLDAFQFCDLKSDERVELKNLLLKLADGK